MIGVDVWLCDSIASAHTRSWSEAREVLTVGRIVQAAERLEARSQRVPQVWVADYPAFDESAERACASVQAALSRCWRPAV
jgi:hypothetical protein